MHVKLNKIEVWHKQSTINNIEIVSEALKDEINIDLHAVLHLPNDELITYLTESAKFNMQHLEQFSEILYQLTLNNNEDIDTLKLLYQKLHVIYQHLEKNQNCYSFERYMRLEEINKFLQENS